MCLSYREFNELDNLNVVMSCHLTPIVIGR